jgi:hypothetical protein
MRIEALDSATTTSSLLPALTVSPKPVSTSPPQQLVTITEPVKIKILYGETVLQRGTRLPIVARDPTTVTIRYLDGTYAIPIASTDLH